MYQERRQALKEVLKDFGCDAFFSVNQANSYYFTGYSGDGAYCIFGINGDLLVTDGRYIEQAQKECPDIQVECWDRKAGQTWPERLGAFCRKQHMTKIAFEEKVLTYQVYNRLQAANELMQLVPGASSMAIILRKIKEEEELDCHRKAAQITDTAFAQFLPDIKIGMSEKELAARLEFLLKMNGADGLAFPSIIASGQNSSLPHAIPSDKKVEKGDFITFDFGARYRGYCADMTRTVSIGAPTEKQKTVYETVLKAQIAALNQVKAGAVQENLHLLADYIITEAGFGGTFTHSLGHGVGLNIHEEPYLRPGEKSILQPGMVVTIEPGIYIPGWGGVRIEDMVAVTEQGCEIFSKTSKELMIL